MIGVGSPMSGLDSDPRTLGRRIYDGAMAATCRSMWRIQVHSQTFNLLLEQIGLRNGESSSIDIPHAWAFNREFRTLSYFDNFLAEIGL
jgi:hypothetical protein